MHDMQALLKNALRENHLVVSEEVTQKFLRYLELIQRWNRTYNLTSITEPYKMIYLHLIDSLIIAPYLQGSRALDVGSGAGLPGIPLAILEPERDWVLLDKNGKKTRFLTQVISELNLKNVKAVHSRCEDFQPSSCFDSILSRAFGTIRLFIETTEHLLCPDGIFIAMKGKYPEEELNDLPSRFTTQSVTRLTMQGMEVERHVVMISRL